MQSLVNPVPVLIPVDITNREEMRLRQFILYATRYGSPV